LALSAATTMSQAIASSQPPPSAAPLTAATVGIDTCIRRFSMPWNTSIIFTTLSGVWSTTSTPEEKVLSPLPVMTRTLAVVFFHRQVERDVSSLPWWQCPARCMAAG